MNKFEQINKTNVKNIVSIFLVLLIIIGITSGCGQNTLENNQSEAKKNVSFKATDDQNNTIANIDVLFQDNDKLLETLKNKVELVEKNGEVKSIAGVSENEEEQIKWQYTINGVMSSENLIDAELNDGDVIEFKLLAATSEVTISFEAVDNEENVIADMEVTFSSNQELIDKLKQDAKLEEDNNMITKIGEVSQNADEGLYWTYTINDEMAMTSLIEAELKTGDVVKFTLIKFD